MCLICSNTCDSCSVRQLRAAPYAFGLPLAILGLAKIAHVMWKFFQPTGQLLVFPSPDARSRSRSMALQRVLQIINCTFEMKLLHYIVHRDDKTECTNF